MDAGEMILLNCIKSELAEKGLDYSEDDGCLRMNFVGDPEMGTLQLAIHIYKSFCVSYCILLDHKIKRRKSKVTEYLNRANFGTVGGHFVLDYCYEHVLYKIALPQVVVIKDGEQAVNLLLGDSYNQFHLFFHGLLAVEQGLQTPEEAIRCAKNSDEDDEDDDS